MTGPDDITQLLEAWQNGDESAMAELAPLVYRELHDLAGSYMRAEPAGHTLQPTALVNEAFLRLAGSNVDYDSRKHFYVIAARTMRRVLVDRARSKSRQKRGEKPIHVTLTDDARLAGDDTELPILALDEAMLQLAKKDERAAEALELVYFGGLAVEDAAEVLGIAASTAYEELRFARAWIRRAVL